MTLEEVCAEVVRQWPEWQAEAEMASTVEQDSSAGDAVLAQKLRSVIAPLLESYRRGCAQFVRVECVCQGEKLARQIQGGKADAQS